MIHRCEKEHRWRSVREDESDSEKVRLWLCRTDEVAPDDDEAAVVALAFAVVVVVAVVAVDAALAVVFDDAFDVAGVRLVLLLLSILIEKQQVNEPLTSLCHSWSPRSVTFLFSREKDEEKQQSTATRVSMVPMRGITYCDVQAIERRRSYLKVDFVKALMK